MKNEIKELKTYSITGTYHGSIIYANSEGDARRLFHKQYNGESIIYLKVRNYFYYP